jgi:hypothetical protein
MNNYLEEESNRVLGAPGKHLGEKLVKVQKVQKYLVVARAETGISIPASHC